MKKSIILLVLALICGAASFDTYAQREYSKDCRKEAEKAGKKRAKELKKDKWVYSGAAPLETVLEKYFLETGDCGAYESRSAEVNGARSIAIGNSAARSIAVNDLTRQLFEDVKGLTESEINEDGEFFNNRMATKFKGTLNSVLLDRLTLSKKTSDGKFQVIRYFVVDKEKLEKLAKEVAVDMDANKRKSDDIRASIDEQFEE